MSYPYIRRYCTTYDKGRMSRVQGPDDKIVVSIREPDPADGRADYDEKLRLTPDQARHVATELWKLAEQIDGKTKRTSTMKRIRSNTERIARAAKQEAMN